MKGKKAAIALAAIMGFGAVASLGACGGSGGSGEIDFWYSASVPDGRIISEMIDAYNNGQGKEDGVHVTGDNRGSVSRTDLMVNSPNVIMLSDEQFKQFAVEDYYLDLTQYYEEMPGNYKEEEIPTSFTRAFRIDTKDDANGKRMAGEGAAIQGIPFGVDPMIYYYSIDVFEEAGIKIISCEEKDLEKKYPGLQPHGYAEYTAENGAKPPVEGATVSENLAGESVYKIFNNLIPMNFEEFRYLSKCFTKSYTDNDSTTDYGSATHHWFSFGWSVGGDCVGYDGEKYSFTALDSSANYLVTAKDGVTVNGKHYAAQIILELIAAFDLPAYGIHLEAIVNGLEEKIAAGEKFLLMIVHEFIGMKRNHDKSIFLFAFISRRFKAGLFISPSQDPVPVSMETL